MVVVLLDRSGSMHDPGKNCIDVNGLPITTPIRKWQCAVNAAIFNVTQSDAAATKRYFLWAFGTLVSDPNNTQFVWSIDKNGNPIANSGGQVLPAVINDSVAMNRADMLNALNAQLPVGPFSDDCGTPLAGGYCTALTTLTAYRGSADFPLTLYLESDGLENATPSGAACQGLDAFSGGNTYVQGNPNVVELTTSTISGTIYVSTADGMAVPTWQTNMLDVAVTGTQHISNGTGVPQSSGAFTTPPGVPNLIANINFIKEFIETGAAAKAVSPLSVDRAPVRVRSLTAAAAASDDPDLSYLKGVADITKGRLIAFGDGSTPVPGDPTAPHAVPADINNSGCVDSGDYTLLKQYYNKPVNPSDNTSYAADINIDGRIDINDYLMMKAAYGRGCATPPGTIPVLGQSLFGFDSTTLWSSSQATLSLVGAPKTEGNFSMSIGKTGWRTLNSVKFATSAFSGITSKMALDVNPPKQQTNPKWIGQVLLFANCPSAGVYNQFIGAVELTGKPLGSFSSLTFSIPLAVKNAMTTAHSDFSFSISLNANDPGYLFDNLRFVP
jgi:hypothetical protein